MTTTRPSHTIYLRNDPNQIWRECDSPYELGYIAGEHDYDAGLPAMTDAEQSDLWGLRSGYAEGYADAYADFTK